MAVTIKDSYTEFDDIGVAFLSSQKLAQTFTASSSYTASGVSLKLKGASASAITGGIYATTAGKPSGAALATFSFNVTTSEAWLDMVSLSSSISLVKSTVYAIVIDNPAVTVDWYGDGEAGTNSYTTGAVFIDIGSGWVDLSSPNWIDQAFKIYGEAIVTLSDVVSFKRLVAVGNNEVWYEDI